MHDMLMKLRKGSWCVPLSKALRCAHAVFLALPAQPRAVPLLCVRGCAGGSLVCLAAGCSAALHTLRLSSQACLPWSALIFAPGLFGADATV